MESEHPLPHLTPPTPETAQQAADFGDLLQELRVLLQGAQVLTAFLIVLPFYSAFASLLPVEKWVYLVTFTCSLSSLILLSAPAAQHRLEWPLRDRAHFKRFATRMVIIGLVPLSLAGARDPVDRGPNAGKHPRSGGRAHRGRAHWCRLVAVPTAMDALDLAFTACWATLPWF